MKVLCVSSSNGINPILVSAGPSFLEATRCSGVNPSLRFALITSLKMVNKYETPYNNHNTF